MRCWAAVLVVGVSVAGCKKSDDAPPPPPEPPPEPVEPAIVDDDELPPEPPPTQDPLGETPISLDRGVGGVLDLDGDGLPAIRKDGRRVARIDRAFDASGDHRHLALQILDADSGRLLDEVVVFDPARDLRRGEPPSDKELARRVARANQRLARNPWMSMIEPEEVVPDGWIRCHDDVVVPQSFEVASVEVSYLEPRLVVKRDGDSVLDRDMKEWQAEAAKDCTPRSYIADAAVDLIHGALLVEVQYCGECASAKRLRAVLPLGGKR